MMATSWCSTPEFPLFTLDSQKSALPSGDLGAVKSCDSGKANQDKMEKQSGIGSYSKTLWAMNSMRNIIVKSNNHFKLPGKGNHKIVSSDNEQEDEETVFHTGLVNKAFLPMRLVLLAVGRWPFPMRTVRVSTKRYKKSPTHSHLHLSHHSKRIRNYSPTLKTFLWFYYGLTTLFILYVLVMSTLGFLNFFLGWDKLLPCCEWASTRRDIFRENLVMFLLIWGCLVHSTLSSFSFLIWRKKLVKIFNYWNVAADELQIEDVRPHRRFVITANIGYLGFLVLIYIAYSYWKIEFVREGAELFGSLTLLPIIAIFGDENTVNTSQLRIFGIALIIYAIYASRSFLFMFSFKCRFLRSLFRVWNGRLNVFLKNSQTENEKGNRELLEKLESERLLREMALLLKLVKLTDRMFAIILQTYYAIQLVNMCFELYMLAKSGSEEFIQKSKADSTTRAYNIVSAIITLCQNVYFFFTVSLDGAYVGEEAALGMEVVRSHAVSPTSSVHRKYLTYNLSVIYSQKITLTGGKYFNIDRPFILTVLGAVLTYFVIILQVGPTFQQKPPTNESATILTD